jgi:hypothetical protein
MEPGKDRRGLGTYISAGISLGLWLRQETWGLLGLCFKVHVEEGWSRKPDGPEFIDLRALSWDMGF